MAYVSNYHGMYETSDGMCIKTSMPWWHVLNTEYTEHATTVNSMDDGVTVL